MRFVLALDQGTTSSRAIVFDERGAVRGIGRRELTQHFPEPGWVEHDPAEIFAAQRETAREALRAAGLRASDCAAIGIANQRETTVLWDRATGEPLHRAIVWQDRRTAPLCEALRERGLEPLFREKTGLVLDPYFSGTKLAWLLDNVAGARERARRGELAFGTIDTWLIWNLTGAAVHATDVTNASRTLLLDLETLAWSDELLAALDIPRAVLPEVRPSAGGFGTVAAEHLGAELPIAGVAGDQHAALVGQAGFARGIAKSTFGTGSFLVLNTGDEIVRSRSGLLTTVAFATHAEHARYALEGSIFVTGAAVQWLRDGLGLVAASEDVEALAASVPDTGGVYFVPGFTGLGAPHWDPHARGAIFGLTRGSTGAHLARAALEAMAYQTVDVVRAMERDAGMALAELRVDGGAARNDLAMQFCADVLGVDVVRPRITETTALGAAYLAGIAAGIWRDSDEVAQLWEEERRFTPACSHDRREHLLSGWHRAIGGARAWSAPE